MKASANASPNVRLRRERERHCWSQEQVAEAVGTTALNVSRWERGLTFPNPYFRQRLCMHFEKTPLELGLLRDETEEAPDEAGGVQPASEPEVRMVVGASAAQPPLLPGSGTLVGRAELIERLKQNLLGGAIAATTALSGLPGVGKTALAIALARDPEIGACFSGILWAGLGLSPNISGLLGAWGAALGLSADELGRLTSVDAWATRLHAAIGTRRMLLVIDDVWALEDALAFKVGGPNCVHVVTTRYRDLAVRFAGEHALDVPELTIEAGVELMSHLAPDVITGEPSVARELVHSVGGLPLALTLMGRYLHVQAYSGQPRRVRAALGRLHSVEERQRLAEPQSSLERPPNLPPGASLSLQAAIELSVHRLTSPAQQALWALAAFPSKPNCFAEEAALAVCDTPPEVLDELSDAGLLEVCGPGRYTVHQTVSDYARLRPIEESYRRMAAYYARFVETHSADYATLDAEASNVLAALQIAAEHDMPEACVVGTLAFSPFLEARGLYATAEEQLDRSRHMAETLEHADWLAMSWLRLGRLAELRGDLIMAEQLYQRGTAIARTSEHQDAVMRLLAHWAEVAVNRGHLDRAEQYAREGLALARSSGDRTCLGRLLRLLGEIADCRADYARGDALYDEALAAAREVDDRETIGALLQNIGEKALKRDDDKRAESAFREGLEVARSIAHKQRVSALLNNMGAVAHTRGKFQEAEAYYRESLLLAREIGNKVRLSNALLGLGRLTYDRKEYGAAATFLSECLLLCRTMAHPYLMSDCLCLRGDMLVAQGHCAEAEAAFTEALEVAQSVEEKENVSQALYGLGRVAERRGDHDAAHRLGMDALRLLATPNRALRRNIEQWLAHLPHAPACVAQAESVQRSR